MSQNTAYLNTTVAATFRDLDAVRDAAKNLKTNGFSEIWIGIARRNSHEPYAPTRSHMTIEAENWLQRVFGDGEETLHDALIRHGVSEQEAQAAGQLEPEECIITVNASDDPREAANIIRNRGGRLISGYKDVHNHSIDSITEESFEVDIG